MKTGVVVIIPAFNEEHAVGSVLQEIPRGLVDEIIVVDNNSDDQTRQIAAANGATVLTETRRGYGYACLKGMAYIDALSVKPGIVVFLDADYSDFPGEMRYLIDEIKINDYDIVIGSRALGNKQKGAMTPQQIAGNLIATKLLKWLYGVNYTDLGPFRAIKYTKLTGLNMQDKTYGWTVEMQVKAAKSQLKYQEVPVNYRQRIGHSKVSGTFKGTILAGYKIILTLFRYI